MFLKTNDIKSLLKNPEKTRQTNDKRFERGYVYANFI